MTHKSILITGCSSGIGLAAAHALRQRGYWVIASCRKMADVVQLREDGFADAVQLDLASSESIQNAVKEVLDLTEGRLFALFNNGAYGLPGAVEDLSRDALRRQFETNVFGPHELTCRLLPTLLRQKDARIVQNSSVLGLVAMPNRGAYISSKFALEGLTDTLRLELTNTSVKVSLIEPGPITSHFRQNALAAFEREIDVSASRHGAMYDRALERLRVQGSTTRYTLPESAVLEKLIHALESPSPRARYYVTVPTYVMAMVKRFASTRLLDKFTLKFGNT